MNVFDFALRMEEDGRTFYQKLSAETEVPELKRIFALLASAEEEHYRALEEMRRNVTHGEAESKTLETVKNIFATLLERKELPEVLKKNYDGCRHAIRIAMAGIRLYERLAAAETSPGVARILAVLADEERKHLEIMENIYDFVESPGDFLAWGEFSNLRGL